MRSSQLRARLALRTCGQGDTHLPTPLPQHRRHCFWLPCMSCCQDAENWLVAVWSCSARTVCSVCFYVFSEDTYPFRQNFPVHYNTISFWYSFLLSSLIKERDGLKGPLFLHQQQYSSCYTFRGGFLFWVVQPHNPFQGGHIAKLDPGLLWKNTLWQSSMVFHPVASQSVSL